ncbi:uncharacterized protein SEPMUDRAFT_158396 [Sphaerulina musiva SO2202]|uniref:Fms interacting protein n=1 Tax=Sphaerulina musiva (strain SO2202) TaxID=692275 RepID=M3CCX3_SPHMS|nr:uncharacterized protein SEPMUDRAFT_158396 [Sphaerulina musiva SO2202]EMF10267.1 hypothetical protein SEPMUDRAFT_158396 [Sphaerulina musiva SO2202]
MSATSIITDPVLTSVLAAAHETRQQCNSILDFISSQNTSASASASVYEDTHLLTAQKTLSTRLAILRGLNRKAILSVRNTKHETSEKRQEIDALHLQLQNLYYEQRHLRGEIRACEDYDHKFPLLNMLPASDFLSQHPEDFALDTSEDDHDLTIARIEDEHAARKELDGRIQELTKQREALMRKNDVEKAQLAALDESLEKWIMGGKEKIEKLLVEGRKVSS